MTNAESLAAEIAAATDEATAAVGDGPLSFTLFREGEPTGDDFDPVYGPPTEHTIRGIKDEFTFSERQSGLVEMTDIKLGLVTTQDGLAPLLSDQILVDGVKRHVKAVTPFDVGGPAIYYTIHLKG